MKNLTKYFKKKSDNEKSPDSSNKTEKWTVMKRLRPGYVLVQNDSRTSTHEAAIAWDVEDGCEVTLKQVIGNHKIAVVKNLNDIIQKPQNNPAPKPAMLYSKADRAARIVSLSFDDNTARQKQASS